jgi:ribosomal protein S18 acetylase RimI-like enzyme
MTDAEILHDTSPDAMARAAHASIMALNRILGRSPKTEVHREPGFFRWHTPGPLPFFNGVVVSSPPGAGVDSQARSTLAYFEAKGVSSITWWLDPGVSAEAWSPLLLGLGFTLDPNFPGMAAPLDSLVRKVAIRSERHGDAPSVEIRRVDSSAMLREWAEVFVTGYEFPLSFAAPLFDLYDDLHGPDSPLQSYFAYLDGAPVATSSILYAEGVAGIYDVATLPSARGRGLGAAVTLAPLRDASERGYRVGVLQSSVTGLSVYERIGFRTVCRIPYFTWKRSA